MHITEVQSKIKQMGGTISIGINWQWARFANETQASECFAVVSPHIEHRGIYGDAFRFRGKD